MAQNDKNKRKQERMRKRVRRLEQGYFDLWRSWAEVHPSLTKAREFELHDLFQECWTRLKRRKGIR